MGGNSWADVTAHQRASGRPDVRTAALPIKLVTGASLIIINHMSGNYYLEPSNYCYSKS
jgi:hypothetical protein